MLVPRQLDQIRKVLGRFGVTDPGDITDLFRRVPNPITADVEGVLKALELKLPANISFRFVAESLLAGVFELAPSVLKWRDAFGAPPNLAAIKPGATQASKYHKAIFASLNGIFDGSLSNGRIEQEINTGIHRVDIMYDNFSKIGFFNELKGRISLKADFVPAECKNYSDDVGSPEYDQLGGRLNNNDRQVGLLVVRKIVDAKKSFEHVKAKWAKEELIVVLDDDDIVKMHRARFDGASDQIDKLLWLKVRSLQLSSQK
jgi:hypothetical protein